VIIGGSPVRIESRPNKKEGFGREYYLVAIGPDGEVARYFLKLHPPTSITAFAAENDMIGVVVIQWQSIEETRWYVWDGYESRLEEHGNDFRISKYYDRLKAAHPELPD